MKCEVAEMIIKNDADYIELLDLATRLIRLADTKRQQDMDTIKELIIGAMACCFVQGYNHRKFEQ